MLFAKPSRSLGVFALEQRMMFDAAGAATLEVESTNIDYVDETNDYDSSTYSNVLAAAEDVSVSEDGNFVYAVSSNSSSWSTDSSVLSVFSVAEDGSLTLVQSYYNYTSVFNLETYTNDQVVQNEGLAGASLISMSSDQNYLYVFGEDDNSLVVFSRDTQTGELTRLSSTEITDFGIDGVSSFVFDIETSGDYLYVTGGDQVLVLSSDDEGSLSLVAQYSNDTEGVSGLTGANSIAISADGTRLVVGASGGSNAVTLFDVNDDGTLTYVSSVTGEDDQYFINSVKISADGQTIYALNDNDGSSLLVMTYDDAGELTLADTYSVSDEARTILVSEDGTGVFVMGAYIDVFLQDDTADLTAVQTIDGSDNDLGANFSSITQAYLSADHSKLFVVISDGILSFSFDVPAASYTENEQGTLLLPTGIISDSELDALDDYQGASYTITRESGALVEDEFGFQEANGLTLEDGKILKDGSEIATFTVVDNLLTVSFTASTSQATAQQVLRQITYSNSSNDPVANGASPSFSITVNDGDGNETSVNVQVNLIGVNNPAEISTTTNEITYQTGDDYTLLFSDTSIETIEADQTIWKVQIAITGATADDLLKVGKGKITLEAFSGTSQTVDNTSYSITEKDGVVTVTLYIMDSSENAASVIDGIAYKYTGDDTSGERTVSLSIIEYTSQSDIGETTTLYDGTTTITLAAADEDNVAPTITSTTNQIAYTENGAATSVFPDAVLTDSQMDAYNDGAGNYHGAELIVSIADVTSSDQLVFEEANGLALTGSSLTKDGVVIATVSNEGGVLTITFTEDNGTVPTTEDVQNVLNQIQYQNSSETPESTVNVSVTLSDQFGLTSNILMAQINITALNDTPEVTQDASIAAGEMSLTETLSAAEGLTDVSASNVSSDGGVLYVADSSGNIAVFTLNDESSEWEYQSTLTSVDGVDSVDKLITTADGQNLYLLGNEGDVIAVYSLSEDLVLSNTQVIVADYETNEITVSGVQDIVLSEDGLHFYYINSTALSEMTRDAETGELSFVQKIADAWSSPYLWNPSSLTVSGDYVFVTTNFRTSTLIVFEQEESGLEWKAYIRDGSEDSAGNSAILSSTTHVAATDDGEYIYVVNDTSIYTYSYDAESESFLLVTDEAILVENLSDLVVSADNEKLFVLTSDGSLYRYIIGEDGSLTQAGIMQGASSEGAYLSISDAGHVFLQGTDVVAIYDATGREESLYEIGFDAVVLAPELTIFDEEMSASDNYSGLTITLSGSTINASDTFGLASDSEFTLDGENLLYQGEVVGRFVNDDGTLSVAISSALTQDQVNALARSLTFENASLTQAATLSFTVSINDGDASSNSVEIALNVAENLPPQLADSYQFSNITETESVSIQLPDTLFSDASNDTLTWQVTGLPNGLSFNSDTLVISGNAVESGEFLVVIQTTDTKGQSAQIEVTLTVESMVVPSSPSSSQIDASETTANPSSATVSPSSTTVSPSEAAMQYFTQFDSQNISSLDNQVSSMDVSANTALITSTLGSDSFSTSLSFTENTRLDSAQTESTTSLQSYRSTSIEWSQGISNAQLSLLDSVMSEEEKAILAVMSADGIGLPEGVEYDLETGRLNLDKDVLGDTQQIELHVLVVDENGETSVIPVEVKLESGSHAQVNNAPFSEQVNDASSLSVFNINKLLLNDLTAAS
ncbi:beta-propeller fold lactonase family protein [Marinomonas balearica]|uniref:6-phosphogluconolactonase (Cycloisomerase 2 family) n=1 Tax=Marinomonas balearica TaxID=491947 RepID=A0A4R6M803_9GAMM|nr:beta-propeller fold lactonase family protein [Marinomonas balearica]TDO97547.1 6-phosphogluconolactonase (cycloisomerase 2 family) [Marinomonas balearica]